MAFVKCQSIPPISPLIKQVDTEKKTYDANYEVKDRFEEPIEIICTPVCVSDAETHCGSVAQETFGGSTQEKCHGSNSHIDAPQEFIPEANGGDKTLRSIEIQKNDSFEDTSCEYNAACQALREIIDETVKKIELTSLEQQTRELGKTHRFRLEEDRDGV